MYDLDIDFEVYLASSLLEWRGTSGSFDLEFLFKFSTNLFFQSSAICCGISYFGVVIVRVIIPEVERRIFN
jgi:hypothetical protein